jgi:hypothetical protein
MMLPATVIQNIGIGLQYFLEGDMVSNKYRCQRYPMMLLAIVIQNLGTT